MNDLWILIAKKLSGEATPEDLAQIEEILRKDPDLHYSLQIMLDAWQKKQAPQTRPAEDAWERHAALMRRKGFFPEGPAPLPKDLQPKKSRTIFFSRVALVCSLFVVIGCIFLATRPKTGTTLAATNPQRQSEVVTKNGTRTKLLLPDGTEVWLNAGSRLVYDSSYGSRLREVTLTGEAFFDVVKNKEKPFVIHTGIIKIRVLGTAFNVKSYPGDKTIETSLIRGRIEVTYNNQSSRKLILAPNQKLVIDSHASPEIFNQAAEAAPNAEKPAARPEKGIIINPLSHFGPDSVVSETAWLDNKLVFQDEAFADLARKMERWYGVKMIFDEPSLDSLHFTGSFEKENIQQALTALQLLSSFNFSLSHGEVHIIKKPAMK